MFKFKSLLICAICVVAALSSCRKADSLQKSSESAPKHDLNTPSHRTGNSNDYQQALDFLRAKKQASPTTLSQKIDTIMSNLSSQNLMVFEITDSIDIIMCDLATYKNPSIREYSNTYYKAYFFVLNDTLKDGSIFTIHTNLSKSQIDSDLENVFFSQSAGFTGQTVVNTLDDQFVHAVDIDSGVLKKDYSLSPRNGVSGSGSGCVSYYLVTTNYYTDGTVEVTEELLMTLCGSCGDVGPYGQPRLLLPPNSECGNGGSGTGPSDEPDSYYDVHASSSSSVPDPVTPLLDIWIEYPYTKKLSAKRGLYDVIQEGAYIPDPSEPYLYPGNKWCTRVCTLGGQQQVKTYLGGNAWSLFWGFMIYVRYINFADGTPTQVATPFYHSKKVNVS